MTGTSLNIDCPAHRPRVLLAEDHPAMAAELAALLSGEYEVIGIVHDGQALIDASRSAHPDVIVSDIAMPGVNGLAAAGALLAVESDTRIVFVTVVGDREVILRARSIGVLGYVLKYEAGEQLLAAVRAALDGTPFLSSSAQQAVDEHRGPRGPDAGRR